MTTKASLFLKAPLAPIQEVAGSERPRARRRLPHSARGGGGARPGPSPGPARGTCGRPELGGPRRPAPEPLGSPSPTCRRHDPTRRGARARGPRGVSPGPAPPPPCVSPDPSSCASWPSHPTSPPAASAPSSRRRPGCGTSGCQAETEPLATAKARPQFCADAGGSGGCRTRRVG